MLNVAMVGCGGMAHWHAQQLKAIEEVNVVALVDVVPSHSAEFKQKFFPEATEFTLFDDLLEKPPEKLDAVVIMTPHAAHFPECKAALEHGLHVLVEKPMVTSVAHALELEKLVEKTGKLLAITFQSPYTAEYRYLAAERDAGRLGKVQIISGWLTQDWLKLTAGKWRQDPAISGGGMLYDSGAHLLNAFVWLMNEPVVEIGCFYDNARSPVDINGVAILRFASGAFGSIAIGGNCPPFRTEIQIQTDQMLIVTDQYGGKLEMNGANGKKLYPHVHPQTGAAANTPHRNFVDTILGRDTLCSPVRYGVMLSKLMAAMYESAQTRKIVRVG
jgi:predicted dehydrogenase